MIRRVASAAVGSRVKETIVVLGHQADQVKEALKGLPCRFVYNEHYLKGQSSSVKAGVQSLLPDTDAVLVLPGDVAFVSSRAIDIVVGCYFRRRSIIVTASYRGKKGHPVLFDKSLFKEILETSEESLGLKAVLDRHRSESELVDVGIADVLHDFDTREELKKYTDSRDA